MATSPSSIGEIIICHDIKKKKEGATEIAMKYLFGLRLMIQLLALLSLFSSSYSFMSLWGVEQRTPRFGQPFRMSTTEDSSTTTSTTTTTTTATAEPVDEEPMLTRVQRAYQKYEWKYQNSSYSINYRVEEPTVETGDILQPQPLLLVHGFGGNVNHFRHNIPAFQEEGYRVFAIDLIGFGASEKAVDVEYSIDLFVQLLRDFVLAMNERYHKQYSEEDIAWMVAGNSIGGLCCLGLAQSLPEQIHGVVLFNCAGGMSAFRYEDVPLLARPILYLVKNYALKGKLGEKFFADFKTKKNVESILRKQGVYKNQVNVDDELLDILLGPSEDEGAATVFLKVFGGEPGPTPESILPFVKCPVLALWGEADPWTPHTRGTSFYVLHHDFHLEVLPETGHCPHDECPDLVHSHMIPWMKRVEERFHPKQLGLPIIAEENSTGSTISMTSGTDSKTSD